MYSTFTVLYESKELGTIKLMAPGDHNIQNALAAVAIGLELRMPFEQIKRGLERFQGVFRRFQIKHDSPELIVIDDYAHHPTEVKATIQAARAGWPERRIVAVFQPHLYSRTRDMYQEFGLSFFDAEILVVTDIYPSREAPIEGVDGSLISNTAKNYGHKNVHYIKDKQNLPKELKTITEKGDIIITMGAGDIYRYGEKFVNEITSNQKLN
jgi:UDP-N-acetylmuramate--alanine ligase